MSSLQVMKTFIAELLCSICSLTFLFKRTVNEENRTYSEKTKFQKASGQENHFSRLPEELCLSIFDMVADLKSLSQCLFVSKNFASTVLRVRTISVNIRSNGVHSRKSFRQLWTLPKPKTLVLLEKLKELESIYLEYNYPGSSVDPSCTKWKVKFGTDLTSVERFVALVPFSAHAQTSDEPHEERVYEETETDIRLKMESCYWVSYARYVEWMRVVVWLSSSHTSLKKVTITDSAKQGKIVIGEEQLGRIRSECAPQAMFDLPPSVETAHVPVLHLPLSRYVMKRVVLLTFNCPTKSYKNKLLSWDFEDEEKLLREAIMEIYKNHSDEITEILLNR